MNVHHQSAKTKGTFLGDVYTRTGEKLNCYESHKYGEDYQIIIFDSKGNDLTDDYSCDDMDTVREIAEM